VWSAPLKSGIERAYMDESVRPQDDLFDYANGKWLKQTEIPADRAFYGTFVELREQADIALRQIIEDLAAQTSPVGSEAQKIGHLYASFMDEPRLERLDIQPLATELKRIDSIRTAQDLARLVAHLYEIGSEPPFSLSVHQDNRDSTKYIVDLSQSGLGLPDRDYYLKDGEDGTYKKAREGYLAHIEKMFKFAGEQNPAGKARDILELETKLAKAQWDKVANRDPIKTYNKVEITKLATLAPGFNWSAYLKAARVTDNIDYLIVSQPSYLTALATLSKSEPLNAWKTYFKWHLLSDYAPWLAKRYVDENFAFYGTTLRGVPEMRPRWKRGVSAVESSLGEALGKIYVAKHFPPQNKARMQELVANLLKAYGQSIDTLDWMSPQTKAEARAKLAKFSNKIGYPDTWRDYSSLTIAKEDLVGNMQRAQLFEYQRQIDKLGKPIDRNEWLMTPQTINAYYNPEMNEIVFPAAILQPPYFDVTADDAANYGGIGAIIGHEISHGFDDQGSQYDGDGNLRDWWTKEDHDRFAAKTKALVEQYGAYEPIPGYHINGELTLGENIADNAGLAIAYKAYKLSASAARASVIDGFTAEQRFYVGWAQAWREKVRDKEAVRLLTIDPHSPSTYRAIGAAINQDPFYAAFALKQGDKMYLPPDKRTRIW
jgi:predicted metalloendopeptidase